MKFTITPLGGARRDVDQVVDAIVRYLQPPPPEPAAPAPDGPEGPSRYYADSAEEPDGGSALVPAVRAWWGRWTVTISRRCSPGGTR
jgi:hypothetical protein